MKIPRRQRPPGLRFNITPLIDVVFLLVIFFLVTAHFAQHEQVAAVELPHAVQVADIPDSVRRLVVSVTADGTLFVKGRDVSLEEFEMLLHENTEGRSADFEVRIRSDRAVPYGQVEPLLFSCLRAGVTKIAFAVTDR
ncbi:MAG: biopolymer transporter ExbD [Planctomycetaceae bacterium]|nr:biopolymer transporter ExbD [Planctomycetaceae bacterium]